MKKVSLLPATLLMGIFLAIPNLSAANRQTSGNATATSTSASRNTAVQRATATKTTASSVSRSTTTTRPATTTTRPATTTTRPATTTTRPATTTTRPATTTTRPATSGNASTSKPSTPPAAGSASSTRTGSAGMSSGRPAGNTVSASPRPATPNTRPTPPPTRPTPPPPTHYAPGYNYRPPQPHVPPTYSYYRPTPPPNWRPIPNAPNFNTILGITLGTLLSNTVNSLIGNGYHVSGYTNNAVFLNNVNYCGVYWPDVTMYYTNGYLEGSLFSASSISYDPTRYNFVYSNLTSQYGLPVSTQSLMGGGMSATWWGYNNSYITLSFYPEYINGLGTRYFTTLSTGN